ncbi:exonuclease SbcCD subunit D C-terminal domain-containing protein [Carboxylicivirga caseinilyticus]|uniref:exonuclease SbcCD subunit D C-terminal domain-containing protein n=1 Tax=Carboxylicivirga caseinilyticus TaxID=3417572 RepID=UPI003D341280|nr:exonuclease SbcCD subunit D C-terminal domain-containing protein [Marinilabiliaceae bacterium A049]
MKILHTSDWHLGHRLHEQSQSEEQQRFLQWLITFITQQSIDVLLVSGDVFDTGTPSSQSLAVYYNFLVDLKSTGCKHVFITGGNHDAPGTLNAPKEILKALDIHVIGKATENAVDEVFCVQVKGEQIILAAVPYLRDQDIRRAIAGESFSEIGDRYKSALIKHYQEVAEECIKLNEGNHPVIGMGHLFAIGGTTTDSEQTIYVGNAGDIGASDFPDIFDYIALGHLHRHQNITEKIVYSGTPYILSFSEVSHQKKVVTIEVDKNKISAITAHDVPAFRQIKKVKGDLQQCIFQLKQLADHKDELEPWVEVVLDADENNSVSFTDIYTAIEGLKLKVLKVSLNKEQERWSRLLENSHTKDIKDISPLEVFKLKCEEQNFDIEAHPEVQDAFFEILQIAKKQ